MIGLAIDVKWLMGNELIQSKLVHTTDTVRILIRWMLYTSLVSKGLNKASITKVSLLLAQKDKVNNYVLS